ncbi:MAG: Gfo/Idh/MocA family oxidoreductase [Nitrososphaerales archaeon]
MTKIAVVGVGGWGKNHVRVLSELESLCAVCDIDAEKAKTFADRYKVNSYTSINEMLENEKLDGAIVSTPTTTHLAVAKQLMEHHINVLVEKPMAPSSLECEQMRTIAKRNNVLLTTGYIERFNPAVNDVKNIIADKRYGEVLMLEFHRENRMPSNIQDVGIIYDTSVHDIDTAIYLFDSKPHIVFARAGSSKGAHEDFAAIILGFKDHKIAFIASNWVTPKKVRQFIVVCTDAIITGDFIKQEIRIDQGEDTVIPRREFQEPLILELKNFIDAVNGKTKSLISMDDAINTTRVAEAALLSSRTGAPIFLDLK